MEMLTLVRENRPLRRLLAALAVSQAGDWLYNLALLAFVYERTHSVGWTAATTAARVLPVVLLTPLGGVLADRYDRRQLMIASDAVRMAAMGLLAAVALFTLPVLLAPALAAIATAASMVYPPAVAATLPRLVADTELAAANAARTVISSASVVVGPAGGAALLLLGSPALAFLLNAATFGVSALLLLTLSGGAPFRPPAAKATSPGMFTEAWEGVTALRSNRLAMRLLGADIMCSLLYGAQTVLLLLLGRRLGYGDAGYGYLLAGQGLGGVAGAVLAARMSAARHTRQAVAVILVAVALAAGALAVTPSLPLAVVLAVVCGTGSIVVEVIVDTVLARTLDEAVLARAYGLAFPASIAGIAVGALIAAPLVGLLGLPGALAAIAALLAGYAALLGLPARTRRRPAAPAAIGVAKIPTIRPAATSGRYPTQPPRSSAGSSGNSNSSSNAYRLESHSHSPSS
jgi:MFS family permease